MVLTALISLQPLHVFTHHTMSFSQDCMEASKQITLSVNPQMLSLEKLYMSRLYKLSQGFYITRGMTICQNNRPVYQLSSLDRLLSFGSNILTELKENTWNYVQAMLSIHASLRVTDDGYVTELSTMISILQSYGMILTSGSVILAMRAHSQLNITHSQDELFIPWIHPDISDLVQEVGEGMPIQGLFTRGYSPSTILSVIIRSFSK